MHSFHLANLFEGLEGVCGSSRKYRFAACAALMYACLRREAQRMLKISWETAVRIMPAARFPTHLLLCVHCLPAFIASPRHSILAAASGL